MIDQLTDQLIRHEGIELMPYRCPAGKLTIGVGRNLSDKGISRAEAMMLLRRDITDAREDVAVLLDYYNVRPWSLSQARQEVLINMAFCMGRGGLGSFRLMFEALDRKDFAEAARQIIESAFGTTHQARAEELAAQMERGFY